MEIPIELLAHGMDDDGIFVFRKLVYPLGPKRDGESNEQHRLDEDHREFQVSGDSALNPLVIGNRVAAFAETHQDIDKESRPADKERAHEPMAELDDVIDLKNMLR